jgi:hypothetical protein
LAIKGRINGHAGKVVAHRGSVKPVGLASVLTVDLAPGRG